VSILVEEKREQIFGIQKSVTVFVSLFAA